MRWFTARSKQKYKHGVKIQKMKLIIKKILRIKKKEDSKSKIKKEFTLIWGLINRVVIYNLLKNS